MLNKYLLRLLLMDRMRLMRKQRKRKEQGHQRILLVIMEP